MHVQLAEAGAERLVLVDGHDLVAEEDHTIFEQRLVHRVELPVGHRPRQFDAGDFRADGRGQCADFDTHRSILPLSLR
jgi:hypothetical protein